jgi:hypothetical protein
MLDFRFFFKLMLSLSLNLNKGKVILVGGSSEGTCTGAAV